MKKSSLFFFFVFILLQKPLLGQHWSVAELTLDELKEKQILGSSSTAGSLMLAPLNRMVGTDSVNKSLHKFQLNPLVVDNQFNSKRPFGWNNGSMINAKGMQFRLSTGFQFNSKYVNAAVQPELVMATNPAYTYSKYFGAATTGKYVKWFPGQSFIDLKKGKIALGLSTENIWWGSGRYNALMFSNNAPGFPHISFHTSKPIKTKLGAFEWQLLVGKLTDNKELPVESFGLRNGPVSDRWRYLNAIILTWQPKWISGLSLGFSRGIQFYGKGMDSLNQPILEKYLPVVSGFFKSKINTQIDASGENDGRDQQASFMLQYTMPTSHIEFYVEYGYADFKANLRDLAIDAQHGGAYILGIKKLFPVNNELYYVLNAELTHTSKTSHFITRNWTTWYTHGIYLQGFSHQNQILGAGSGLGNNMQTIHFERINGSNKVGIKFQKIQNNPSLFLENFNNIWLSPLRWTDFTLGPTFQYSHKRFTLKGEVQAVYGLNYAWLPDNLFNLYLNSSLIYRWR